MGLDQQTGMLQVERGIVRRKEFNRRHCGGRAENDCGRLHKANSDWNRAGEEINRAEQNVSSRGGAERLASLGRFLRLPGRFLAAVVNHRMDAHERPAGKSQQKQRQDRRGQQLQAAAEHSIRSVGPRQLGCQCVRARRRSRPQVHAPSRWQSSFQTVLQPVVPGARELDWSMRPCPDPCYSESR